MGRMKRLLRPKPVIYEDQAQSSMKTWSYHLLKGSKFAPYNRQFDTQNTPETIQNRLIYVKMSENYISAHYSLHWQEKAE